MNIIFIGPSTIVPLLQSDSTGMRYHQELYDPARSMEGFNNFFNRIDGVHSYSTISISQGMMASTFWDRYEFINYLKMICQDDIYIRTTSYYDLELISLNSQDIQNINQKLTTEKYGDAHVFPKSLRTEIERFVREYGEKTTNVTYASGPISDTIIAKFRDHVLANLVYVKFTNTKEGDHYPPGSHMVYS